MDNYKVVLVDDEVEVIDAIEQRIHWDILGFEVVGSATNGVKALELVEKQQPDVVIDNATGLIQKGVIVRQLLLPGHVNDAKAVLKYLYDTYHDHVYISMMSQFTPIALKDYPEINRTVTRREYERLVDYALEIGITNAFIQEGDVAKDSFIPAFDCEGV